MTWFHILLGSETRKRDGSLQCTIVEQQAQILQSIRDAVVGGSMRADDEGKEDFDICGATEGDDDGH
jgi:hypothetical protein